MINIILSEVNASILNVQTTSTEQAGELTQKRKYYVESEKNPSGYSEGWGYIIKEIQENEDCVLYFRGGFADEKLALFIPSSIRYNV
mgnify:CR=1 FL=1